MLKTKSSSADTSYSSHEEESETSKELPYGESGGTDSYYEDDDEEEESLSSNSSSDEERGRGKKPLTKRKLFWILLVIGSILVLAVIILPSVLVPLLSQDIYCCEDLAHCVVEVPNGDLYSIFRTSKVLE